MNKEQFQGQWNQIKGKVKEKWGKLTDDDLTLISGKRDQLVGALQKKYGKDKEIIEKEVSEFESQFDDNASNDIFVESENELESERQFKIDEEARREQKKTGTDNY